MLANAKIALVLSLALLAEASPNAQQWDTKK